MCEVLVTAPKVESRNFGTDFTHAMQAATPPTQKPAPSPPAYPSRLAATEEEDEVQAWAPAAGDFERAKELLGVVDEQAALGELYDFIASQRELHGDGQIPLEEWEAYRDAKAVERAKEQRSRTSSQATTSTATANRERSGRLTAPPRRLSRYTQQHEEEPGPSTKPALNAVADAARGPLIAISNESATKHPQRMGRRLNDALGPDRGLHHGRHAWRRQRHASSRGGREYVSISRSSNGSPIMWIMRPRCIPETTRWRDQKMGGRACGPRGMIGWGRLLDASDRTSRANGEALDAQWPLSRRTTWQRERGSFGSGDGPPFWPARVGESAWDASYETIVACPCWGASQSRHAYSEWKSGERSRSAAKSSLTAREELCC